MNDRTRGPGFKSPATASVSIPRPQSSFVPANEEKAVRIADYRRRWMVIVGVRDYGDPAQTGLASLDNPVNDACRLYDVLAKVYGFDGVLLARESDVVHYDEPSTTRNSPRRLGGNGTRDDIIDSIADISARASFDDLFLFCFSGHGIREDGYGFLLPFGARANSHASFLGYEELFGILGLLPCRHRILVFDCCYAGIGTRGVEQLRFAPEIGIKIGAGFPSAIRHDATPILLDERWIILAATDQYQATPDGFFHCERSPRHSPFTEALACVLERVPAEVGWLSDSLVAEVRTEMTQLVPRGLNGVSLRPVLALRGGGQIVLRRIGLALEAPVRATLVSGSISEQGLLLRARGGTPPFRWTGVCSGSVRTFQFQSIDDNCSCQAIPTGSFPQDDPERLQLSVTVTDAGDCQAHREIDLLLLPVSERPLSLRERDLPVCVCGQPYLQPLHAEGGRPPYRWSAPLLPAGLTLGAEDGLIRGVVDPLRPNEPVRVLFKIVVTDQRRRTIDRPLSLAIVDPALFAEVPEGTATLGASDAASGLPAGTAFLPRFFIRRYPVTWEEWCRWIVASNQNAPPVEIGHDPREPVTGLSANDIDRFCAWFGTRLPTGWEWEKAARGPDGRPYPWGKASDPNACNCRELGWQRPTKVDQFPHAASLYQVFDCVGNCNEWVAQRRRTRNGWQQVFRGGSCEDSVRDLRVDRAVGAEGTLRVNLAAGELTRPAGRFAVGFRDLIESQIEPIMRPGWVAIPESSVLLPEPLRLGAATIRVASCEGALVGRYPVSNGEYAEFVAESGAPRPVHWAAHGASLPEDEHWRPVVNVGLPEAEAYARWKSECIGYRCVVLNLNLWLFCVHWNAAGDRARAFPWGDGFDPYRCNSVQSQLGQTMRVWEMPQGKSAHGVFHLIGNVAQWVAPGWAAGGDWTADCSRPEARIAAKTGPDGLTGFRLCVDDPDAVEQALVDGTGGGGV